MVYFWIRVATLIIKLKPYCIIEWVRTLATAIRSLLKLGLDYNDIFNYSKITFMQKIIESSYEMFTTSTFKAETIAL